MEQINENELNKKAKKKSSTSNKVLLSGENFNKATSWLEQINTKYQGMIKTNRSELINFALEELDKKLTPQFLNKVQEEKLDDVTKAKWVYLKLQDAQKNGENLRLEDLMKEVNMTKRRSTRRTKTKNSAPENQNTKVKEVENKQN